jgi:hypothetical protein
MTVTDGLVVGAAYERPRVMVVPGGNVLVVEAGQDVADSVAQDFAVTEYIAVDLATGRQLWTAPVVATGGGTPPVAVSGNLLLAGNADGSVTAKALTTGAVVWHDPWLEECGAAPAPRYAASDVGIAADGPLVAVSFSCSPFTPAAVVQRLDAATGRPLWSWKTRVAAMDGGLTMTLAGAARDGGVILVTYAIVPASAEQRFAAALPHAYQWPARIGPVGPQGGVLALDAADGHPRWTELGSQWPVFTLADGAVCETVLLGQECRDDTTGAPALPVLVTGHHPDDSGYTAISGGLSAVTVAPFQPGEVTLRIVNIRGGATMAQARIPIGQVWPGDPPNNVVVIAAGPLPGGATLVLVTSDNLDGPVLALRVPPLTG